MSRTAASLTVAIVLVLHGAAWAALSAPGTRVTPPVIQSAPPIFGKLVSAPEVTSKPMLRRQPPTIPVSPVPAQKPVLPVRETVPKTEPVSESVEAAEAESESPVQEVSEPTVIPPRVDASARTNPPPAYPSASRRAKEQGRVVLAIHISQRGRVTSARIQKSSGFLRLDRAALDAVRHWRYQPAMRGGQVIGFDYLQPVVFSLDSNSDKE